MIKHIAITLTVSTLLIALPAVAAIQYGSTTRQAPFAASTTQEIGNLISKVVDGSGVVNSSWTSNQSGIFSSIGGVFVSINTWLRNRAGIDFFGILKAIGHLFLFVIHLVADLIKKLL